jgi:RNA polymerase sigma-70 factor (ECF subfamily)
LTDTHRAEFGWSEKELDVKEALDSLDEKYRAVVCLYYYEEYKTDEIAKILSLPKGTVVSRLDRARKRLRVLLADYGEEF